MRDFECSVASRGRDEPIFATASQVRRWLLVEVRGSWGRDAVADTNLGRHVDDGWRDRMRSRGVRIVAIRRDFDRRGHHSPRIFYIDSSPAALTVWRRDIGGLQAVADATASLPAGEAGHPRWNRHDDPLVLVCTNGRHDACCATFGRPVVRALRSSAHAELVWECSHIGGDRFAGNIVLLPDGLYFGRCTAESAPDIVDGYLAGRIDLERYRGRSTLGYTHQAAEYFTRRQLALTGVDAVRSVRRVGDPAAGRFEVQLAESGPAAVTVRRSTTPAPTPLTCTGPGDATLPRYELVDFRR